MRCMFCGCLDSRVLDSRPTEEGSVIRRRRECPECGKRFTTYEIIENLPIIVIKKDKTYGKIVCRCETISEGEILEAIRVNPGARDLDGVKRRTRSGMGRCQGGFCGSKVVELLARELDVEINEITKFGGNSKILYERTK